MDTETFKNRLSISGQIEVEDVAELSACGVEVIVCNRPDGEDPGQPCFSEIKAAAETHGMEAVHIPFSGADVTAEHVDAFRPYLESEKRIHLYCRSGRRSQYLLEVASADEHASM